MNSNFGIQFGNQRKIPYLRSQEKVNAMVIINSREFRANQTKYLGMAAKGEGVILRSRSLGSFKITPITEDDTLMTKEEFFRRVNEGIRQIEEGKGRVVRSPEELDSFFDSL